MNRSLVRLISVLCFLTFLASCRSTKKISDNGYAKEQEDSTSVVKTEYNANTVAESNCEWQDITLSGTISIGTTSSVRSSAVIKMIKDKSISISIRPLLGIEMGKIYFANDTLTVVDKYHKVYVKEYMGALLGKYINIPVLQNLLLSRPFLIGEGAVTDANEDKFKSTEGKDSNNWILSPVQQYEDFAYNFDMYGNNIHHFNIIVATSRITGSYAMNFSGYKLTENGTIATKIDASVPISDVVVNLYIDYGKSIKWNTGTDDSIVVSSEFKRYAFSDIMNLISKH